MIKTRKYYCKICNAQDEATHVSDAWFVIRQGPALAVLCNSLNCVQQFIDNLRAEEASA